MALLCYEMQGLSGALFVDSGSLGGAVCRSKAPRGCCYLKLQGPSGALLVGAKQIFYKNSDMVLRSGSSSMQIDVTQL